jgi:hypothetical protein
VLVWLPGEFHGQATEDADQPPSGFDERAGSSKNGSTRLIIEQIGRRDRRLAILELGEAYLGKGVDEGLLVDASNALQIADIERIPGAAVPWMLALELAVCLFLGLGTRRVPLSRSWPFPAR